MEKDKKRTTPITKKSEIQTSNDPKIDEDMPGFPHHPSSEKDLKKKKSGKQNNEKAMQIKKRF